MKESTRKPDLKNFELTLTADGRLDPSVVASLKTAIVSTLDAEASKAATPGIRTPTGFPREIKINARFIWPIPEE
jgi:hypothetical protein